MIVRRVFRLSNMSLKIENHIINLRQKICESNKEIINTL